MSVRLVVIGSKINRRHSLWVRQLGEVPSCSLVLELIAQEAVVAGDDDEDLSGRHFGGQSLEIVVWILGIVV